MRAVYKSISERGGRHMIDTFLQQIQTLKQSLVQLGFGLSPDISTCGNKFKYANEQLQEIAHCLSGKSSSKLYQNVQSIALTLTTRYYTITSITQALLVIQLTLEYVLNYLK
mgnify:CR=1 FL=1